VNGLVDGGWGLVGVIGWELPPRRLRRSALNPHSALAGAEVGVRVHRRMERWRWELGVGGECGREWECAQAVLVPCV